MEPDRPGNQGVETPVSQLHDDIPFRARALAQAHPLTESASSYRESRISIERETQPLPEFADWAATAFLVGYCVRRVEEADAAEQLTVAFGRAVEDLDLLGAAATRIADDLRSGRPAGTDLLDPELVESALDAVIGSEVDKRREHWREHVSNEDWAMFEQYVTWWVVHGYAVRAAERPAVITS